MIEIEEYEQELLEIEHLCLDCKHKFTTNYSWLPCENCKSENILRREILS